MDYRCEYKNCSEEVFWECSCKEKLKFCDLHIRSHLLITNCSIVLIEKKFIITKIRLKQNALVEPYQDAVKLAITLIKEIKATSILAFSEITKKKNHIENLTLNGESEQIERTIKWSKNIDFMNRDRKQFSAIIQRLFAVTEDSDSKISDIERLQAELQEITTKYDQQCEKAQMLEEDVNLYKKSCEDQKKEIHEDKENIMKITCLLKNLKDELELTKKNLENTENEAKSNEGKFEFEISTRIKEYQEKETELQLYKESYEKACDDIKRLENLLGVSEEELKLNRVSFSQLETRLGEKAKIIDGLKDSVKKAESLADRFQKSLMQAEGQNKILETQLENKEKSIKQFIAKTKELENFLYASNENLKTNAKVLNSHIETINDYTTKFEQLEDLLADKTKTVEEQKILNFKYSEAIKQYEINHKILGNKISQNEEVIKDLNTICEQKNYEVSRYKKKIKNLYEKLAENKTAAEESINDAFDVRAEFF